MRSAYMKPTYYDKDHKNVHCTKCTQYGEEYLNGVTLQNIERILEKLKSMLTEIAVVDYNNAA